MGHLRIHKMVGGAAGGGGRPGPNYGDGRDGSSFRLVILNFFKYFTFLIPVDGDFKTF